MILGKSVPQELEPFLRRVHELEQLQVLGGNRPRIHHRLEVQHLAPVFLPIDRNQNLLRELLRLRQRQNLKKFIQCPKSTRENHQSLREIRKPELAHKEIMEFEIKRWSDVRVWVLFEGQMNIQ